jgi:hypothetical protein
MQGLDQKEEGVNKILYELKKKKKTMKILDKLRSAQELEKL